MIADACLRTLWTAGASTGVRAASSVGVLVGVGAISLARYWGWQVEILLAVAAVCNTLRVFKIRSLAKAATPRSASRADLRLSRMGV